MLKKHKLFFIAIVAIFIIFLVLIYKQFTLEKPKVVVVLKTLDKQYWEIIEVGARKGFKDFDIEGKVIAPKNGRADEQVDLLEDILKEHPDVLIVSPIESDVVSKTLGYFVENQIPVLLVDTNDSLENKTTYVGTDNIELGRKAGILLGSQLQPEDKVALISGEPPGESLRIMGAKASLEEVAIKIVSEKTLKSEKDVENEIKEILKEHPDLKGVIVSNDYIALSVFKIIQKQALKIPIIGADGISDMVELVEEGTLTGTVAQNPYDMGYLSVEAAFNITNGNNVDNYINSGADYITTSNAQQRLDFLNRVLR